MSERDELAETIASKLDTFFGKREFGPAEQDLQLADALLAAGYRKPRTVTTAAELDALPVGSVVLTEEGWPAVKFKTFLAQCWRVSETFRTGDYPSVRLIEHAPTVLHEAATR